VLQEYGVAGAQTQGYELDYLISPQLGGTDDISNLWPEPDSATGWNADAKDALEGRLHQLVCQGKINLATAQRDLATTGFRPTSNTSTPTGQSSRCDQG